MFSTLCNISILVFPSSSLDDFIMFHQVMRPSYTSIAHSQKHQSRHLHKQEVHLCLPGHHTSNLTIGCLSSFDLITQTPHYNQQLIRPVIPVNYSPAFSTSGYRTYPLTTQQSDKCQQNIPSLRSRTPASPALMLRHHPITRQQP